MSDLSDGTTIATFTVSSANVRSWRNRADWGNRSSRTVMKRSPSRLVESGRPAQFQISHTQPFPIKGSARRHFPDGDRVPRQMFRNPKPYHFHLFGYVIQ
jgi:hypothetical protein